ncbi:hypothetical protein, conserved [Babesia ovata]|uniref:Uncharacterized protein n=1 Tax=Babesia ovata TaxID=189622 RepID=A0A2H6K766_9APIC|nr:uncharacterized protein BOVATA_003390 [Babesia ovata]GBE58846.1 hypothetical protein, conserved [Babesia ovata]
MRPQLTRICQVAAALMWLMEMAEAIPAGQRLEELSQEYDLGDLPLCRTLLPSDSAALSYCLNGSTCRIGQGQSGYAQVVCDCSEIATSDYFFAGPQCATKVARMYRIQQARNLDSTVQVVNTSFFEDVLGMNQWKNDVNSVGHLPL